MVQGCVCVVASVCCFAAVAMTVAGVIGLNFGVDNYGLDVALISVGAPLCVCCTCICTMTCVKCSSASDDINKIAPSPV